jgi:hypothetical protein
MFALPRSIRFLLIVIVSVTAMSLAVPASAAETKAKAGKKKVTPPKGLPGVRIWVDDDGALVFMAHTEKKATHDFAGTIEVVGAKISGATGIDKLEPPDFWKIDYTKNTVAFGLRTYRERDRITLILNRRAKEFVFDLKENGQPMPTHRIHIGPQNKQPDSSKFTLPGK